jgi:hypothetical protein
MEKLMLKPLAAVFGDVHSGDVDPTVRQVLKEICKVLNPKYIIVHDLLDGKSISHHEKRKYIKRVLLYQKDRLSLKKELDGVAKDLNDFGGWAEEIVVVKSNHDEFLLEILEDGRFVSDPINYKICSELAVAMMEGKDPVKHGVEISGLTAKNIRWLQRDESFELVQIECGVHGDKGPNGSRGSLKNMEASYGRCIIGHSHTPGILRGAYQVGTSSYLRLDYNNGPSSWLHTMCLLYPNGSRQLINILPNGLWRL